MSDEQKTNITFIDNPHAPDFFADAASGYFTHNGNLRITFESARIDHSSSPGPLNRVVIGRLVMSESAAESMAKEVLAFIAEQRRKRETA